MTGFRVTAANIETAKLSRSCPVLEALREANLPCVGVGSFNAWFGDASGLTHYAEVMPDAAKDAIAAFTRGETIAPFEFYLGTRLNAGEPEPDWYRKRWIRWLAPRSDAHKG